MPDAFSSRKIVDFFNRNIRIVILRAKTVSILAELAKNEERFNFEVDIPIWCSHYRLMNKNWFEVRGAVKNYSADFFC